jgi:hypothetical protein
LDSFLEDEIGKIEVPEQENEVDTPLGPIQFWMEAIRLDLNLGEEEEEKSAESSSRSGGEEKEEEENSKEKRLAKKLKVEVTPKNIIIQLEELDIHIQEFHWSFKQVSLPFLFFFFLFFSQQLTLVCKNNKMKFPGMKGQGKAGAIMQNCKFTLCFALLRNPNPNVPVPKIKISSFDAKITKLIPKLEEGANKQTTKKKI